MVWLYHVAKSVSKGGSKVRPERQVIGARRLKINCGRPTRRHTPSRPKALEMIKMNTDSLDAVVMNSKCVGLLMRWVCWLMKGERSGGKMTELSKFCSSGQAQAETAVLIHKAPQSRTCAAQATFQRSHQPHCPSKAQKAQNRPAVFPSISLTCSIWRVKHSQGCE